MKKFFTAVAITLFSFLVLHSDSLAGSIQASATTRLLSDLRNPVEGTLGLEQSGLRLSASLGNESRLSGSLDLLARSKDGLYVGLGLNADRVDDSFYSVTETSDTTVVVKPHDHGKHKGDKHHRGNKTYTRITTSMTTVSLGGVDLDLSPELVLGVGNGRVGSRFGSGLFVESRILFTGGDVSNRTSVGVRF